MEWPTKSSVVESQQPAVLSQAESSSSKAALIELKPSSSVAERESTSDRSAFDFSVLVGDAHSLFRFTMFARVPPEPKPAKKAKKKLDPTEKEAKMSNKEMAVRTKLLPKVQNEPQTSISENLSVTIEHDSDL